ncbi:MAG TPA: hypothetical protein VNZ52_13275 [Candidatus Thermoplasmatota archaeon]|nr:hypothetical protein [Candidatus Thermoplasmatota archaeon]
MPTATVWCAQCDWALEDLPQPLAALLPRCFSCHSQPLVVLPHGPPVTVRLAGGA